MIEFLTHETIEEALAFAERSHADSAWKDYRFDAAVLRRNLQRMLGNPQYFTCIYRKEGKIIGYFFASLGRFLFSDTPLGMENGVYIAPEHRGGTVAWRMHRAFLDWCRKHNAEPFVEIYFGSDVENSSTYSFFRKLGMIECGKVFRSKDYGMHKHCP